MKPVVGIGIACLDHLIVVPKASKHGGHVADYRMEGGGLTASALVAAARLGAPTRLWTSLGDDEIGLAIAQGLAREGVDTSGIHFVRGARSPVSVVHIESPSGERTIYHFRGNAFEAAEVLANLDEIEKAGALLVDSTWHTGALAGTRRTHDAGVPVIGDFDPRRDPELAAELDYLIVSEQVGKSLANGPDVRIALQCLREFGPLFVAITAGAHGCWYLAGDSVSHCPAFRVDVVDTTGAGDAFHGAFGFAIAQGWQVSEAVRLGCAVGALCCTALGGRAGLPDLPTAQALLRGSLTEQAPQR